MKIKALTEDSETAESIGGLGGRPVQDTKRIVSTLRAQSAKGGERSVQ
jgi:hypothetical protein